MVTATATQVEVSSQNLPTFISWEDFQRDYLEREDGYDYEWLNGVVEKSIVSMDKKQLYIVKNLIAFFRVLLNQKKVSGELIAEGDLFFKENHRRPDICWLTDEQIYRLAEDAYEVPAFVIEVISTNDAVSRLTKKMQDYRSAGVQVVWQIFPIHQEVHVYAGTDLKQMTVRSQQDVCSAAPVLPAFQLSVEKIFEKQQLISLKS